MHILDGFLTNRIAIALDVISCANILYAARRGKLDFSGRMVPVMGVLAAFLVMAGSSSLPVPLGKMLTVYCARKPCRALEGDPGTRNPVREPC
jgi:ABC-type Co2+ transport system permease subunit